VKPASIRSIAREAGLSHSTVSLVLNNRGDELGLRSETQRQVREIAKRLNYVRNPLARGLAGKSTMTIGLLWSLAGPHLSEGMARNITLRTQKRGYTTYLFDCMSDPEVTRRQLMECRMRGVDAVVLRHSPALVMDEFSRQLKEFKAAVVVSAESLSLPVDLIQHDMVAGYVQAADHLANAGRKRPAILSPHGNISKVEAFLGHCRQRGMSVSDQSAINISGSGDPWKLMDQAIAMLTNQFPDKFPFDSLICTNDEIASAALVWLRDKGLLTPENVTVIGCNDAPFCVAMSPPLASIERHDEKVADAIEELIFSLLDDSGLPARRRIVPSQFIWRESAGRRCDHQEN
jgi:LacI family transcriptional regulator